MIDLNKASSVEIGGAPVENRVVIDVKNDTAGKVTTRVTVEVGCGSAPKNLLSNKDVSVKATYLLDRGAPEKMDSVSGGAGSKKWRSIEDELAPGSVLSITLERFPCETQPGDAELTVVQEVMAADGWKEHSKTACRLAKKFKIPESPELCYFRADPEFILHAGNQTVTVSFLATGYDTAFLFRNNEEVQSWSRQDRSIAGAIEDRPSITSVYRLSLRKKKPGTKDEERKEFSRTVQVMSPGWNRLSLPQGSPTRLFKVDSDFETGTSVRLYGIYQRNWYTDPENKTGLQSYAGLYSSANGVDQWDEEPGAVPAGMETSPGVYYGNRLWLIGGSAAGSNTVTNEIWCYQKNESSNVMEWKRSSLQFPPATTNLPPRFGHSCVVFDNEIWVLGGHDTKGNSHQDIWRIQSVDNFKTFTWAAQGSETAPGPKRCLHSSVVVRAGGDEALWVYGGAAFPRGGTPYVDLWYKRKGHGWHQQLAPGAKTAIEPDPGKPLGSALVAYSDGVEGANPRLMLLGSFLEWKPGHSPGFVPALDQAKVGNRISSFHFEYQEKKDVWESKPVGDGWQQFEGENFAMQTLALNGFIYVYTFDASAIYPTEGTELVDLKLNIRIP
jgi:hypothetical protein